MTKVKFNVHSLNLTAAGESKTFPELVAMALEGNSTPLCDLILEGKHFGQLDIEEGATYEHPLPGYQQFLDTQCADLLVANKVYNFSEPESMGGTLPPLLAPSTLSEFGYKFPTGAIANLQMMDLLDDYFGVCYHPERIRERYTENPMPAFKSAIHTAFSTINDMITKCLLTGFGYSVNRRDGKRALDHFIELWGIELVKNWWRSLSEKELQDIESDDCFNGMYDQLVSDFGGGLLNQEADLQG